ncbi:MAG: succinate--CoA ligase subunit alpha [Candidatus Cloacimonetes bacterium]|nr:succinate--CoA ligase subunit alpha [Candidatus Cloacimonadota bacterium]MBS3767274.1 succinate--CoA ligase subunit alpha [Candidatus Cloacimonadota bacterium]
MSILINNETKLIVQGITGRDGGFHASRMKQYGTNVVGGVSPGKGGQKVDGIPVFNSMQKAVAETGGNTSIIFVPARFAADAIYEAADSGVDVIVTVTEGIPVQDMIKATQFAAENDVNLIGPNSPGLISPGQAKVGILPGKIFEQGKVGVMSRSGTLTYEVVDHITKAGLGESTCIGIGGDPIIGMTFIDYLKLFEADPQTEAIVMIGEIGGDAEEQAAKFIKENMTKSVVGFIVGKTAPPGKRMGHAGAIISSGSGTAAEKIAALKKAGIPVANQPNEIPQIIESKI